MKFSHHIILLIAVFFICSCSGTKKIPSDLIAIEQKANLDSVISNNAKFETFFSRKATVSLDLNQSQKSFNATIFIKKDFEIIISANVPFLGIEVGRLKIMQDSVYLLNRVEKSLAIFSYEYLRKRLGVSMNYSQIQSIILGNVDENNISNLSSVNNFGNKIDLMFSNANGMEKYIFSKENDKIVLHSISDIQGNNLTVDYSDFRTSYGVLLPNSIEFMVNSAQLSTETNISIQHKEIVLNGRKTLDFSIPKHYQYERKK